MHINFQIKFFCKKEDDKRQQALMHLLFLSNKLCLSLKAAGPSGLFRMGVKLRDVKDAR